MKRIATLLALLLPATAAWTADSFRVEDSPLSVRPRGGVLLPLPGSRELAEAVRAHLAWLRTQESRPELLRMPSAPADPFQRLERERARRRLLEQMSWLKRAALPALPPLPDDPQVRDSRLRLPLSPDKPETPAREAEPDAADESEPERPPDYIRY